MEKIVKNMIPRLREEEKWRREHYEKRNESIWLETADKYAELAERLEKGEFKSLREIYEFSHYGRDILFDEILKAFEGVDSLGIFDSINEKKKRRTRCVFVEDIE